VVQAQALAALVAYRQLDKLQDGQK
jgi:hypothetical protein